MAGIHSTNTKFLVRNFECRGTGTPGVLGPLPSTVSHCLGASAPGHWQPGSHCAQAAPLVRASGCPSKVDSPDIPGADIRPGPRGNPQWPGCGAQRQCNDFSPEFQSFNSRGSLGVIPSRLVTFPGVLILGLSLL